MKSLHRYTMRLYLEDNTHEHLTTGSRVFISFIARVIYYGKGKDGIESSQSPNESSRSLNLGLSVEGSLSMSL